MVYNLGSGWSPQALNQPAVSYPAYPFGGGAPQRRVGRAPQSPTQYQSPNPLGIKAGDFGGAGPFGVKTGDFGFPSEDTAYHTTNVMMGGGAGGMGGGAGGGNLAAQFQSAL